jgi:hypothetical protein
MKRMLFVILIALMLTGCSGFGPGSEGQIEDKNTADLSGEPSPVETGEPPQVQPGEPPSFEVGTVTVISNGMEHEPYEHFNFAFDGEVSADGLELSLEDVSNTLTEIKYADDFQIVIDGIYAERSSYALYNEKLELIYESPSTAPGFSIPTEAGIYLLSVGVLWSNGEADHENMRYSGFEYIFKILV